MPDANLKLSVGDHVLVVQNRYQTLSMINDFLIGLWFLIGSILFLPDGTKTLGIAFFIAGSAELLIRPAIKLLGNLHVNKIDPSRGGNVSMSQRGNNGLANDI